MAGPRESIVELRGWIDQIQKDADALAARKHLFQQPSKPPRPTSNPWGDEPSSFRLKAWRDDRVLEERRESKWREVRGWLDPPKRPVPTLYGTYRAD